MREQAVNESCPSLADLVLASDGGLSPSHKAEMTAHLRQCAPCSELLQLANAYREADADVADADVADDERGPEVNGVATPVPFAARLRPLVVSEPVERARGTMPVSFEEKGATYDSSAKTEARAREFQRRLHKQKQERILEAPAATTWVRQWLPVAALIPLLIIGLALPRMQTVVRAEELLKLASNHERSLPDDRMQRVRIELTPRIAAFARENASGAGPVVPRVKPFFVVRHMTGGVMRDAVAGAIASETGAGAGVGAGANGGDAAVAAMLASHGFDWRQPLSLAGVRAWRSSLAEKRDEVFVRSDVYVLKTVASVGSAGVLREVEVTVRRHDYHLLKLALAFEGTGRLEIAEIEQTLPRASAKAAAAAPIAPRATAPVAMSTVPAPLTRGVATDAAMSPVTTVVGRAPATQPGLSSWLDRTFRATPERNTFIPTVQRLVGEVRQHLAELDTLADRYPEAEVEEQWSGPDRAALRRRVEDIYRRMSRDLSDLELRVSVMFGSRTRSLPVTELPVDWRERATLALAHAEAMERQVRDLMNYAEIPAAADAPRAPGAARVPATFAALWDVVHAPAGGPASR